MMLFIVWIVYYAFILLTEYTDCCATILTKYKNILLLNSMDNVPHGVVGRYYGIHTINTDSNPGCYATILTKHKNTTLIPVVYKHQKRTNHPCSKF